MGGRFVLSIGGGWGGGLWSMGGIVDLPSSLHFTSLSPAVDDMLWWRGMRSYVIDMKMVYIYIQSGDCHD